MADMQSRYDFISRVARLTKDPLDKLEMINSEAKLGKGLTSRKRLLLSKGYHTLIDAKIARWRMVAKIRHEGDLDFIALAQDYLRRLGDDISEICNEILLTLNNYLVPSSKTGETAVFYQKMKADFSYHLAEVKSGVDRQEAISQTLKAYEAATAIAVSDLPPANTLRLNLAFNFSYFLYDIMDNAARAVSIATHACEDADAALHILDRKSYKLCSQIIDKLKEEIAFWTEDLEDDKDLPPPPRPEWFNETNFAGKQNKDLLRESEGPED